ncbi:alpha-L-fucosidase [Bacteroides sp. ET336]|uniref:alpha-L-fucosidase n=1 Tax=Bacteroides sp. ET336 TaxID=2972459 RepID=UPI0021ACAD65|nr:alpha-L-fucosidase [Bacteroides sp. ET336]MCR8894263.1 alpha-L-fucosidase [Bacteroides sp. ET336]MDN0058759.1 alpha-L-fucosidase [Bacteroides caecigallinarum]
MNCKKIIRTIALCPILSFCSCTTGEGYYTKHLEFPEGITIEQKVDMASRLVPTPQQLEWQKMELTAFLHFGINTFTGREWGDGNEDPALFNPTELDAEQWVRTLKDAGFKMVIITAKHHDGFCLWPTKTTKHSVESSPWKDGKGDVVKELRNACDKYGMKFGVYLSPWDRNAACYGDSPAYNKFFIEQLTELLTNYGEVHEVWFDGANGEGPNGKKQVYDWDAFYSTIRTLQPKAVTAIMGDDVRWVGNEKGIGRETEWSATVLTPGVYARAEENNKALGVYGKAEDLGGRDILAKAKELFWYPSEVDVSIRPGWFYHEDQDSNVKSLKHLTDIYFQSVGYNSVLLLNIPPDTRGLINEADVNRLKEFRAYLDEAFADNKVVDGNRLWKAAQGEQKEYAIEDNSEINVIMLQEDISKGQRVEGLDVETLTDGQWKLVAQGTTVGYKRIFRFPAVKAEKIRVTLTASRNKANICNVSAYYAEPLTDDVASQEWNNLSRDGWKVISKSPLVIDLGQKVSLSAFTYAPAKAEAKPDMAFKYSFAVSTDGKNWKTIKKDSEFSNIMNNPIPQTVSIDGAENIRFIRLEAVSVNGNPAKVDINEFGINVQK